MRSLLLAIIMCAVISTNLDAQVQAIDSLSKKYT